jgi:DNA uptake protein ComE-like DNA-binding protein
MARKFASMALGLALSAALAAPAFAQGKAEPSPLDLNQATREQLIAFPGIGAAYADKIIAGRPFKQRSELVARGIMPAGIYLSIKKYLTPTSEDAKAEEEAAKNKPPAPMWDDRGRINLNTASREQLLAIEEIGLAYADKIIQGRPIKSLEDMVQRGIMPAELTRKAGLKVFVQ